LVGVAVNVTELPEHTVSAAVEILTDGATVGLTVMARELDIADAGDAQVAVDVIVHVTAAPLVSVVVVNVALLVPALAPFTFHW
jgi:hypothetical protein